MTDVEDLLLTSFAQVTQENCEGWVSHSGIYIPNLFCISPLRVHNKYIRLNFLSVLLLSAVIWIFDAIKGC